MKNIIKPDTMTAIARLLDEAANANGDKRSNALNITADYIFDHVLPEEVGGQDTKNILIYAILWLAKNNKFPLISKRSRARAKRRSKTDINALKKQFFSEIAEASEVDTNLIHEMWLDRLASARREAKRNKQGKVEIITSTTYTFQSNYDNDDEKESDLPSFMCFDLLSKTSCKNWEEVLMFLIKVLGKYYHCFQLEMRS